MPTFLFVGDVADTGDPHPVQDLNIDSSSPPYLELLGGYFQANEVKDDGKPQPPSTYCVVYEDGLPSSQRWATNSEPICGGLEGVLGAHPSFVLHNVIPKAVCNSAANLFQETMERAAQSSLVLTVPHAKDSALNEIIARQLDLMQLTPASETSDIRLVYAGLDDHWTVHRCTVDKTHKVDVNPPHSQGNQTLVSRLTALIFLNDDFTGGEIKFYASGSCHQNPEPVAVIKPRAGSVVVFPHELLTRATAIEWPFQIETPVFEGSKIFIQANLVFAVEDEPLPLTDKLFQYDHVVRDAFLPRSPIYSKSFLSHTASLYNPHMGVENLGSFLYSFVRFSKVRNVVEIGAGYTTVWLLQALKDNDDELSRLKRVYDGGQLRLLDTSFCVDSSIANIPQPASLLCIDNCQHQKETATGATAVANALGLRKYLRFLEADAFDLALDEEIDLLWCDFGVGSRMVEFVSKIWTSIRPGGFLACHSTLTNSRTREWLEAVRSSHRNEEVFSGIPPGEFVELSLLEPHKRYQNSVTLIQKRSGELSSKFSEPIYSEYA